MRGDMTYMIIIIVAVILGGAILVVGMQGVQQVGGSFTEFFGIGKQAVARLTPTDIQKICSDWVSSGSQMFNPDTIQNLGVAESFRPYTRFWNCCGGPLNALVVECKSSVENCNNGVLDSKARARNSKEFRNAKGDETVSACITACNKASSMYNTCKLQSTTEADLVNCFTSAMNDETQPCRAIRR